MVVFHFTQDDETTAWVPVDFNDLICNYTNTNCASCHNLQLYGTEIPHNDKGIFQREDFPSIKYHEEYRFITMKIKD